MQIGATRRAGARSIGDLNDDPRVEPDRDYQPTGHDRYARWRHK
jgi:hypothetical protein